MKKYKNYNDLEWTAHHLAFEASKLYFLADNINAKHAVIIFDNGYGVSVVKDAPLITFDFKFEIAIIKGTRESYDLVYDTGITDDIIRCDTEEEVSDIMKQVQDLPKKD